MSVTINKDFSVKWVRFSAGEDHVVLTKEDSTFFKLPIITCNWESAEDTIRIKLLKNALDNIGYGYKVKLIIPYMPYSRQDRVTEEGSAFALKCFAEIINGCNFHEVETWDAHSNVTELLINNIVNIDQSGFLREILEGDSSIDCIIAPDAGAYKKVYETCSLLPELMRVGLTVVCAQKVRNVATGNIVGMDIEESKVIGKHCLVLDDICDGGRTFVELAKILRSNEPTKRPCKSIQLAVTHGIFSKGREELQKYYSQIYTENNMEKK
jgi:ribose-phosphate pyrophosphokinase